MIKRVVKIETTKEMIANDINEFITSSDIDQPILEDNERVISYTVIEDIETWYVLVNIGEE
jgi:hypothetical protein